MTFLKNKKLRVAPDVIFTNPWPTLTHAVYFFLIIINQYKKICNLKNNHSMPWGHGMVSTAAFKVKLFPLLEDFS